MKKVYQYKANDLNIVFGLTDNNKLRLLHYSVLPYSGYKHLTKESLDVSNLIELQVTGYNQPDHKGNKLSNTFVGQNLELKNIRQIKNNIIIEQYYKDDTINLETITTLTMFSDVNALSWQTTVTNKGHEAIGIDFISTVNLTHLNNGEIFQPYQDQEIFIPHNSWTGELQWEQATLKEKGLNFQLDGEKTQDSTKVIEATNNSSWSCAQYNPSAILKNKKLGISTFWQINTNGEWHWELTDCGFGKYLALRLFGPTENTNHWWKNLNTGESFTTIPALCGQNFEGFEESIAQLTAYRRNIRRKNTDNETCPVIFNDYMNCLMGNPTTEKEIPLIERASEIGCDYYVIDSGWYSDGDWWSSVGEWQESSARFPNGLVKLMDFIRSKNMIPGLWLEIESMGIDCELAKNVPDNWFFCRHGKRVRDHSRYHLDFRNPDVRQYATGVIKRLVNDYQIGYIKMDYNTVTGIGTDIRTDSFSDALLSHNRAYLDWLDSIFTKYPDLVVENCGSGGMRHDYQMLQRHSLQSITDQTNYLRNGAIAAVCTTGITPEQSAIWSYPLSNADKEEVIFNMVSSMLLRIHQSGHLGELSKENLKLVKEGISSYKNFRHLIPHSIPTWPTGIPHIDDDWFSFGLKTSEGTYIAIWRTNSTSNNLSIQFEKEIKNFKQIYPKDEEKVAYSFSKSRILVDYPQNRMARLFKIDFVNKTK